MVVVYSRDKVKEEEAAAAAVSEVRGIQLNLNDIDNNAESPKW